MARTIPIFAQKKASTATALEFRVSPPLALYVHVPWCVQKCPYCDFNSHEASGTIPEAEYVAALIAEGEWHGEILPALRGAGGFGYDPLFHVPAFGQTAAELDAETKNRVSHRGQAMQQLIARLPAL